MPRALTAVSATYICPTGKPRPSIYPAQFPPRAPFLPHKCHKKMIIGEF